jgi:hypothetical protein
VHEWCDGAARVRVGIGRCPIFASFFRSKIIEGSIFAIGAKLQWRG